MNGRVANFPWLLWPTVEKCWPAASLSLYLFAIFTDIDSTMHGKVNDMDIGCTKYADCKSGWEIKHQLQVEARLNLLYSICLDRFSVRSFRVCVCFGDGVFFLHSVAITHWIPSRFFFAFFALLIVDWHTYVSHQHQSYAIRKLVKYCRCNTNEE